MAPQLVTITLEEYENLIEDKKRLDYLDNIHDNNAVMDNIVISPVTNLKHGNLFHIDTTVDHQSDEYVELTHKNHYDIRSALDEMMANLDAR